MNGFTVYYTNLTNVFEKIFITLKVGEKATIRDIPSAGEGGKCLKIYDEGGKGRAGGDIPLW